MFCSILVGSVVKQHHLNHSRPTTSHSIFTKHLIEQTSHHNTIYFIQTCPESHDFPSFHGFFMMNSHVFLTPGGKWIPPARFLSPHLSDSLCPWLHVAREASARRNSHSQRLCWENLQDTPVFDGKNRNNHGFL